MDEVLQNRIQPNGANRNPQFERRHCMGEIPLSSFFPQILINFSYFPQAFRIFFLILD